MKIQIKSKGFLAIIIALLVLIISGSILAYRTIDNSNGVQSSSGNQGEKTQIQEAESETKAKDLPKFDLENVYALIQKDMSYNEVKDLAGGATGDCATTDVYPDSGRMSCLWSDKNKTITVNFVNYQVVSKSWN